MDNRRIARTVTFECVPEDLPPGEEAPSDEDLQAALDEELMDLSFYITPHGPGGVEFRVSTHSVETN